MKKRTKWDYVMAVVATVVASLAFVWFTLPAAGSSLNTASLAAGSSLSRHCFSVALGYGKAEGDGEAFRSCHGP